MASILVLSATNLSCTQPVGVGGIRWHLANLFAGGASPHDHSAPSRWAGDYAKPQLKRDEQGFALPPARLPPVIPGQSRSFHSFYAEAGIRRQTPAASRPMSRMSDAVRRAARWLRSLECLSMEDARIVRPRTIRAKGVTMQRAGSEYRGGWALFPGWRAIHGGVRFMVACDSCWRAIRTQVHGSPLAGGMDWRSPQPGADGLWVSPCPPGPACQCSTPRSEAVPE
jgi:hypothetical protein